MKTVSLTRGGGKTKKIDVNFNGGQLTSDAGVVLLAQLDDTLRLTERINAIIADPRDPHFVTHQQADLLARRIYSIALGYEDLNDQNSLRSAPALLASIRNHTDADRPLGSSPTLCRLENRITDDELAKLSKLFVEWFLESHDTSPQEIIIDVDATDDPTHGDQVGNHFNAFYDHHCFLPLYFFCGDQLLWSQLRTSKTGGAHGTLAIFDYLVKRIRKAWPNVKITLRGDAGFYGPKLLDYCERHGLGDILGFASNGKLKQRAEPIIFAAEMFFVDNGSSESFRLFHDFEYKAGTWNHPRKIIVKAERLPDVKNVVGKENTRFLVTNLDGTAKELYEKIYCARGDMENRIKEQQLMLFADRTSCHDFSANRFRLLLSGFAYVLFETMRRTALKNTPLEKAQCGTIRLKLLKVAAVVKESTRRIVFELPSTFPLRELWILIARCLSKSPKRNSNPLPIRGSG